MICKDCPFYGKMEPETVLMLCLVDGQVYDVFHPCHMETVERKIFEADICKLAQPFNKNQDMVRAALKIMQEHGLDGFNALETVKIIHGRYIE